MLGAGNPPPVKVNNSASHPNGIQAFLDFLRRDKVFDAKRFVWANSYRRPTHGITLLNARL
jgi:hypothetical protein